MSMAPFQVDKMTGKSPAAFQNPIKTNMRGEITEIVLSVPVFFEKNTFLMVHIPKNVVQDLVKSAAALPESERPQFIRDWIKKNQQAVYDKYVASGGKTTHFDYEAAPIAAPTILPKPKRVEPPPTVFPTSQEPPKRTMNLGELVVRGDKPPEEKIALVSPPERRVIAIAPKIEIPPLPKGVRGSGSPKVPYQIRIEGNKDSSGIGSRVIEFPFVLKIQDPKSNVIPIYMKAELALSQIKNDAREDSQQEFFGLCQAVIRHYVIENHKDVDETAIRGIRDNIRKVFSTVMSGVAQKDREAAAYLGLGN